MAEGLREAPSQLTRAFCCPLTKALPGRQCPSSCRPSCADCHHVLLLISHRRACLSSSALPLLQGVVAPPHVHCFSSRRSNLGRAAADLEGAGSLTTQLKILLKHHLKDLKYPSPAWLFSLKISISKPWRDKGLFCLLNPLPIDSGYQLSQLYFSSSNTCISVQIPRGKGYIGIKRCEFISRGTERDLAISIG